MAAKDFIEKLKGKDDKEATEYDPSYEVVQKTVELYKKIDKSKLDYHDLDLIYLLTIGEWSSSINNKISKIRKSNLLDNDKEALINYLKESKEKVKNDRYTKDKYGMFGTGFFSFKRGDDKTPKNKEVSNLIEMFIKIHEENNEEKCIEIADIYTETNIYGMGAGSLSQILHCIKPNVFPVLNSKGINIYNYLDIDLSNPSSMSTYIENVKRIKEFRDENFEFKNYRVIDDYWSYIEEKVTNSENEQKHLDSSISIFFKNWKEAEWVFDFLADICDKLGVNNYNDPRITMSYSKKKIHLSFTNWLIAGIHNRNDSNNSKLILPLFKENGQQFGELDSEFTTNKDSRNIALFEIEISQIKSNNSQFETALNKTLTYIKKLKSNYKSSPYRYSNQEKLTQSIFDKEIREDLFRNGLEKNRNYFWLTSSIHELTFDDKNEGDILFFNSINQESSRSRQGSKKRKLEDIKKIKKGDIIVGYHSASIKLGIWVLLEAKGSLNDNKIKMEVVKKLNKPIKKEKISEQLATDLNLYGKTMYQLSKEEFNVIENLIKR